MLKEDPAMQAAIAVVERLDAARESGQPVPEWDIIADGIRSFAAGLPQPSATAPVMPAHLRWQVVGALMGMNGTGDIPGLLKMAQQIVDFIDAGKMPNTPTLVEVKT